MAKYASKVDFPVITDQTLDIVRDAKGFVESRFCGERLAGVGADPRQWKYVRIQTHRRAGTTTTALKLLCQYNPSLLITHNMPAANRMRVEALQGDLVPEWCKHDFHHMTKINDHIIPHERMDERWFGQNRNKKYELIIMDCASMIEASKNNGHRGSRTGMEEFRDRLFNICDLLVELG